MKVEKCIKAGFPAFRLGNGGKAFGKALRNGKKSKK